MTLEEANDVVERIGGMDGREIMRINRGNRKAVVASRGIQWVRQHSDKWDDSDWIVIVCTMDDSRFYIFEMGDIEVMG